MSFLLRAALVIGTLSYFAATRDRPATAVARDTAAPAPATGSALLATVGSASAAWSALPPESRQRLAQEAMAELGRQAGMGSVSRDTLADADRRAAWRGTDGR